MGNTKSRLRKVKAQDDLANDNLDASLSGSINAPVLSPESMENGLMRAVRLPQDDPFCDPHYPAKATPEELVAFRQRLRSLAISRQDIEWSPNRHRFMPRQVRSVAPTPVSVPCADMMVRTRTRTQVKEWLMAVHLSCEATGIWLPPELRFLIIAEALRDISENLVPRLPLEVEIGQDTIVAYYVQPDSVVHDTDWIGLYERSKKSVPQATEGRWNYISASEPYAVRFEGNGRCREGAIIFAPNDPVYRPLGFAIDVNPGEYNLRYHPRSEFDVKHQAELVAVRGRIESMPRIDIAVIQLEHEANPSTSEMARLVADKKPQTQVLTLHAHQHPSVRVACYWKAPKSARMHPFDWMGCYRRSTNAHDGRWYYTLDKDGKYPSNVHRFDEYSGVIVFNVPVGAYEVRFLPLGGYYVAGRADLRILA